jgi:hypothetical protein
MRSENFIGKPPTISPHLLLRFRDSQRACFAHAVHFQEFSPWMWKNFYFANENLHLGAVKRTACDAAS